MYRCGPRKLTRALLACRSRASKQGTNRHSLVRSQTSQAIQAPNLLMPPAALAHRSMSDVFPHEKPNDPGLPSPPLAQPLPTTITPLSPGQEGASEYFSPRVLLVDDNAINLKLLVVFAKRQNLRYSEAMNGLEALETFKREANITDSTPIRPFDFVLMDLSMPVMDGLTSTRQIRQFEKKLGLQRSTIVALTGLASAQDQQDASDAGVDMYLVKPVKFADIKRIFGTK
jgi:CheY-like chemotaxis protein